MAPRRAASPGRGSGRDRVKDIQRVRLVAALLQAVAEVGVQRLSVAHVVTRAGVSRRTFYELFADVEECLLAAFDHSVERIAERVVPAYDPQERWQDRIRAGLCALLELLDEDRAMARFVFVEALGAGPRVLDRRARALGPAVRAVDEGRLTGGARGRVAPPRDLVAEGAVGAVCAVLHARLLDPRPTPLVRLLGPLMSMIVLPYLGPAATQAELRRPVPRSRPQAQEDELDAGLLKQLGMRLTYRTVRVLGAVAAEPGMSNRRVSERAGMTDQGQVSKLLHRLQQRGLLVNSGGGAERGAANAWRLTEHGESVQRLLVGSLTRPATPAPRTPSRRTSRGSPPSAPPPPSRAPGSAARRSPPQS